MTINQMIKQVNANNSAGCVIEEMFHGLAGAVMTGHDPCLDQDQIQSAQVRFNALM